MAVAQEDAVRMVVVYKLELNQVYERKDSFGYRDQEPYAKTIAMIAQQSEEGGPVHSKFYDDALELQTAASNH